MYKTAVTKNKMIIWLLLMTALLVIINCQKKPDPSLSFDKLERKPQLNTAENKENEKESDSGIYKPETRESNGLIEVSDKAISFRYQAENFKQILAHKYDAEPNIPDDPVLGGGVGEPAYTSYQLEDKRPLPALERGQRYFYPSYTEIAIIPLQDASVIDFARVYPRTKNAALELRKLLKSYPKKTAIRPALPDLPFKDAEQVIISKFQYIKFNSGKGIFFLTQYTQEEPTPINNEELTANFQGVTNDGKYYVSATFAITHPFLPKGIDFTQDIKRDKQWHYLRKAERQLDGYSDESFQPSLTSLKQIISSISVKE